MSRSMPPVPSANRSHKGAGDAARPVGKEATKERDRMPNTDRQGRQGNSKLNTTHQGYQQDR